MNPTLLNILNWLLAYKYQVLLPAAIIEGPIVSILAGFLVSLHKLNFMAALVVLISGDIIGDCLYYFAGRKMRGAALDKLRKFVGLNPERLERIEKHFQEHPGKTLVLGKITHAAGLAAIISAGLARLEFKKFFFYNLVGTVPKTFILLVIGYFFGSAYAKINNAIQIFSYAGAAVAIIFILLVIRKRTQKQIE